MPVKQALAECMDALKAANDRMNSLDRDRVGGAITHPSKNPGNLEATLVRERHQEAGADAEGRPVSLCAAQERRRT